MAKAMIRALVTMSDKPMPDGFDRGGYAWRVTLKYRGRSMSLDFFTGSACGEPTARDVMECVCSDACGIDNANGFEDWAREYGFDADSRKAEEMYRKVEAQTERLRRFLGDEYRSIVFPDDSEATLKRLCA